MKKYLISGMVAILIIILIIPDYGISQNPIRKKRSEELTTAAIKSYKAQKIDEAKDKLMRAIRFNNKNVLAHEMLSLVFYKEHNFPAAIEHANIAVKIDNKSARAYYILGMINYQQGNNEQAKNELTQSMKFLKDPDRRKRAKSILEKLRKNFSGDRIKKVGSKIKAFKDKPESLNKESNYKPYVAIFDFVNANARTEETEIGATLTEMLVTALIKSEKFTVMERVQLEKVLKEQSLFQSGAIDTEAAIKIGKLAGLEAVILGSVSQLKTSIEADARLIEVETGKALAAANGGVKEVDKIRELADEIAKQLGEKASLVEPKNENENSTNIDIK